MPKQLRETPLTGKTKSGKILTEQEERFCQEYVLSMGNGREAAERAYDVDKEKSGWAFTCSNIASENLKKPYILDRVKEIYNDSGLNDQIVDVETSFLVKQRADLTAKRGGIDIYNRIVGRYEKDNKQKQTQVVVNVERQKEINNLIDEF